MKGSGVALAAPPPGIPPSVTPKKLEGKPHPQDSLAPPAPLGIQVTPAGWGKGPFVVDWTNPADLSEIKGAYYKFDAAPISAQDGTLSDSKPLVVTPPSEGRHQVYVWLVDGSGNADPKNVANVVLWYDRTSPTVKLAQAIGGTVTEHRASFIFTGADNVSPSAELNYSYSLDREGQRVAGGGYFSGDRVECVGIPDGNVSFWVMGRDAAGNQSAPAVAPFFTGAAPGPPVELLASPGGWTNRDTFKVEWRETFDPSGIHPSGIKGAYYKLGQAPTSPTDGTFTDKRPLEYRVEQEGEHTLYLWLEDRAGNVDHRNAATVKLYYDRTPPRTAFIDGPEGTWSGGPLEPLVFRFSSTDNMDAQRAGQLGQEYSWRLQGTANSTQWSPWTRLATVTFLPCPGLPVGEYVLYVKARDAAENQDLNDAFRQFRLEQPGRYPRCVGSGDTGEGVVKEAGQIEEWRFLGKAGDQVRTVMKTPGYSSWEYRSWNVRLIAPDGQSVESYPYSCCSQGYTHEWPGLKIDGLYTIHVWAGESRYTGPYTLTLSIQPAGR